MYLSQMTGVVPMNIFRGGEFHSLGLLSHDSHKMLVGFYDPDYLDELLANQNISCVITTRDLSKKLPQHLGIAECDDPISTFYFVHKVLFSETDFYWKDFDSEISSEAIIHKLAYVAPKNIRIGSGTIVEPNATILDRSIIGENVVIRAGAVIAGEDLEAKFLGGKYVVIPHAGGVLLKDGVEIQGNAQVKRSVYGKFTVVGEETKVGSLVHVAHNVRIGRRCFIAPCVILGGSSIIGDDVWIGPNASISSELKIGNGVHITIGAVVTKDVKDNLRVSGNFAINHSKFISFIKSIR